MLGIAFLEVFVGLFTGVLLEVFMGLLIVIGFAFVLGMALMVGATILVYDSLVWATSAFYRVRL